MKKFILATILMMLSFTARAEFNNVKVNLCNKDTNGNMTECVFFGNINSIKYQPYFSVIIETAFENVRPRKLIVDFKTLPNANDFINYFNNGNVEKIQIDKNKVDTTIEAYDSEKATIVKSSDLVIFNK